MRIRLQYTRPDLRQFKVSPDDVMLQHTTVNPVSNIANTSTDVKEVISSDLGDGDEVGAKSLGGSWSSDEEDW